MGVPAEQSTSEQSRGGSSDATAEPVASQADRDEEMARLEDRWRGAGADLDNLRKRAAPELVRERNAERSTVARAWLPIVDNLERAVSHARDESTAVVDGLRN